MRNRVSNRMEVKELSNVGPEPLGRPLSSIFVWTCRHARTCLVRFDGPLTSEMGNSNSTIPKEEIKEKEKIRRDE